MNVALMCRWEVSACIVISNVSIKRLGSAES